MDVCRIKLLQLTCRSVDVDPVLNYTSVHINNDTNPTHVSVYDFISRKLRNANYLEQRFANENLQSPRSILNTVIS